MILVTVSNDLSIGMNLGGFVVSFYFFLFLFRAIKVADGIINLEVILWTGSGLEGIFLYYADIF